MWTIIQRLNNKAIDMLIKSEWAIISSWIDNPILIKMQIGTVCMVDISFKMARPAQRMIVTADIIIDIPTATVEFPSTTLRRISPGEIWLLRFASISGCGPAPNGRPGLDNLNNSVDFSVVRLDIEVTTDVRNGKMHLPHDPFISICISDEAWFDGKGKDICHCIYTFKYHEDITSEGEIEATYNIFNILSPDFVYIYNGFRFDLDRIATQSYSIPLIEHTFEDKKLGNSGTTTYMRLPNGVNFIDSVYDIDKYLKKDWNTMSFARVTETLGPPPKLDVDNMQVMNSDWYNVTKGVYGSQLHVRATKQLS
ncbi:hypothetical protein MBM_01451 [Drepanopeziza brunnea f. sp. 'multigermtubi' MB_m1]|uniref:Uncharacterized protein n=1 Tax=Marssonina brunnea f. sp. multigermtubi (strain MB_m1) TaxID=1072389 RepID=K1Y6D8_MARBU|nr:uncharacterized protein MBM_01451 [Drepanopeziza brunnea f. sp. 'multigermtubi' MB_m1]EKD20769.1 hypothetical protein MBM_01451 [Drepanopeziza brunnea f. sp. 'multigermtubi' MB_m1]